MVSHVAEIEEGPAETNCRAEAPRLQDGAVVEFRSQSGCLTATGLTTGPGGPQ